VRDGFLATVEVRRGTKRISLEFAGPPKNAFKISGSDVVLGVRVRSGKSLFYSDLSQNRQTAEG
jgi:hypothetical protein